MKKLIPLMLGMALTFGAITTFATAAPQGKTKATKAKSTKTPKKKATKS